MGLISKVLSTGRGLLGPTPVGNVAARLSSGRYSTCLPTVEDARLELAALSPKPKSNMGRIVAYRHPVTVDLSIIISCYNVERYVGECLESVLS